jgi:hypothetical protein
MRGKEKRLAKNKTKQKQSGALNPLPAPPSHIHKKDYTRVNLVVHDVLSSSSSFFSLSRLRKKKKENNILSDVNCALNK